MNQTEFAVGIVAVVNIKRWGTEMLVLTSSDALKLVGSRTRARRFSESMRIV